MNIDIQKYIMAKKATIIGITGNVILTLFKLIAGIFGTSSAMVADAMHSLSDIFSSVIIYICLNIATKQPDKGHPYGHGKAEAIAAYFVSCTLLAIAIAIGYDGLRKLIYHQETQPKLIAFIAAIVSIVIKESLFQYKNYVGKKIGSVSIIAEAWHHRSDAFSSVGSFLAIGGAMLLGKDYHILDPIGAIFIAIVIAWAGIKVFFESVERLMDAQAPEELRGKIKEIALSVNNVLGVETLRVRKSGIEYLVDVHIEVDKNMSVEKSHSVAQEVRETVLARMREIKDLLVHIEPYFPGDH